VLAAGDRLHGRPVFSRWRTPAGARAFLVWMTSILVSIRRYVNENRYHSHSCLSVLIRVQHKKATGIGGLGLRKQRDHSMVRLAIQRHWPSLSRDSTP
jgi:hypothetical protein